MFDFCPAHSAQYQTMCAACCRKLCIGCHPVEMDGRSFCVDCAGVTSRFEEKRNAAAHPVIEEAKEHLSRFNVFLGLFFLSLFLAAVFTALSGAFAPAFLSSFFSGLAVLAVGAGLACWVAGASAMRDYYRTLVCPQCRKSLYSYNPLHYILMRL